MVQISLQNVSRSFGSEVIFSDVTAKIEDHDRIGLVGPNGTGRLPFCGSSAGNWNRMTVLGKLPAERIFPLAIKSRTAGFPLRGPFGRRCSQSLPMCMLWSAV